MRIKSENGITLNALIIIIFLVIWISTFVIGIISSETGEITEKTADGFTIDSYDVSLEVENNNVVHVAESIWVDWYEAYHHGIYKFTPEWLEYTGKDGKTIKRKSVVSNYVAVGDEYSIDKVKKKPRIKIGSIDKYVNEGLKEYVIKYDYDMGKDPYKNGDEFIFHFFGDYWGTEIQNPSITVKMPKEFDENKISFFTDKYRKNDVTDFVNYYVIGNTLYARFDGYRYYDETGKKLNKSLTIDIELPEGYFEGGSWNYGYGSFAFSLIIFGLTAAVVILWIAYGKDLKKGNKTIEFYPPDDLSSAEIGYIHGNKNSKKLTISLLISMAAKGYIKIDKLEDKKIQITSVRIGA